MKPRVSIVVPVYNRAQLLRRSLDSVAAQTFSDYECIVIDNKSTDDTLVVAAKYARRDSRVRVIANEFDIGPVNNWLRGTESARAELVKILFSDDWMEPDCLAEVMATFDRHPQIGFVYFAAAMEGHRAAHTPRLGGIETSSSFLWRSLVTHNDVPVSPTAGVFYRDDIIRALSTPIRAPIDFDYLGTGAGPDQSVYLNAAAHHLTVYYVSRRLVHYGTNRCSISVETNTRRPGYLMKGVLFAQLFFLRQYAGRRSLPGVLMTLSVYVYLVKWFIRFRLLPAVSPKYRFKPG